MDDRLMDRLAWTYVARLIVMYMVSEAVGMSRLWVC